MTTKTNKNQMANEMLNRANVIAIYRDMVYQYNKNHQTVFYQQLQVYITKVGIILSEINGSKQRISTFIQSVDYICSKIIKDSQMKKLLKALEINSRGNTVKHYAKDIKDSSLDITVNLYNTFIKKIVAATKLNAFNSCFISKKSLTKKNESLFKEESFHKYLSIGGVKAEIKLCPKFTVDRYNKTVNSKATIYWPEGKKDHYLDVTLTIKKTGKVIGRYSRIDISKKESKIAIPINATEGQLNNRDLKIEYTITLRRKTTLKYTTGAFFWKKEHTQTEYTAVKTAKGEMWVSYFNNNRVNEAVC